MYKFKEYFITLLIVLSSGTSLFSQLYYQQFLIFLVMSAICINRTKALRKENIVIFLLICPLMLLNFYVIEQNLSSYTAIFIKILAMMLLLNNIKKCDFFKCYFQILFIIALISIPCYIFGLLYPNYIISSVPITRVWNIDMRLTPIYNFPLYTFGRNNGIYWEGGAFQAFINVALYFGFSKDIKDIKHKGFKLFILIIGLLTTFSTTGYFIFLIIVMNYFTCNLIFNKQKTKKALVTVIALLIIFSYFEINFKTISNKFDKNSLLYSSTSLRMLDTKVAFDLLAEKPFTGVGYQNNILSVQIYGVQNVSNQFMVFFEQFGLPIAIIFVFFIFCGIKNISSNKIEFLFISIILLIIFNTENMMLQPLFLGLLFYRKDQNLIL